MKILFVDFNLPYLVNDENYAVGGATVQALNWINGLKSQNAEIAVLIEEEGSNFNNNTDIKYLPTFSLDKGNKGINWLTHRYYKLQQAVSLYKPDFIYQAGAGPITYFISLTAKGKTKFIHRIANDVDTDSRIKTRLNFVSRFLYKTALKNTDLILCQNEYQYHNLKSFLNNKNIVQIHNPILIDPLLKPIKKNANTSYVAWVGIFQYQKNLPALYEIVNKLHDIEFRIAGTARKKIDPDTINALEKLEHCKNVKFVGYLNRKHLSIFLTESSLLLNTSFYEGFSNTFLEALAASTPIVTLQKTDPDSIIEKNGLGKAVKSYEEMPDAIRNILSNKFYNELCEKCYNYVKEYHDAEKLAKNLLLLLEQTINKN